jgi:hypothetical protein
MEVKKYRVSFDKNNENPFKNKLHKFIRENKLKALTQTLYLENENTVIILVYADKETHNKLISAGFSVV